MRPVGVLLSAMLVTVAVLTGGGPRAAALPGGAGAAFPGGQGVPEPGSASELDGVFCTSSASCLAVGTHNLPGRPSVLLNEVLRWNGRIWSLVAAPDPGGVAAAGDFSQLLGLTCANASDCWAAGTYGGHIPAETFLNEILHWNGRKWTQAVAPNPVGGSGSVQVLDAAACSSATSCWAVGYDTPRDPSSGFALNQAMHWNGRRWTLVPAPDPGGTSRDDVNQLQAVQCTSAARCWAVGFGEPNGASRLAVALRWNGTRWSPR